ncbi:hypothetical protein LEP1GSC088_4387 [Leptospira interrogans str. L1207]|nr:hypothetical protein LEP1GSC088_4387 [Leptospira interrogans str. L1207]
MIKKCEKIFTAPVGSAISELVPKPSNARTTTFLNGEKNHPKS